ncbi:hypothetical protein AAG570_007229 [Ranatra chinensis]|uniref:Uncharacterized protein n=1 Tax=Ranatra chinensis TaxID=642074 RepID=A0ABD0YAG5_9HEMI
MASKHRNMFHKNKTEETTEKGRYLKRAVWWSGDPLTDKPSRSSICSEQLERKQNCYRAHLSLRHVEPSLEQRSKLNKSLGGKILAEAYGESALSYSQVLRRSKNSALGTRRPIQQIKISTVCVISILTVG